MNSAPLGVPRPVTLSQPSLTVSDESVPKVKTSHRVDEGLWNNALRKSSVFPRGCARNAALSKTGRFGGLRMTPVTLNGEETAVTSLIASPMPDLITDQASNVGLQRDPRFILWIDVPHTLAIRRMALP
jgi:hypothetical protein